eukprot:TRINITY_DN3903_c0_g1_i20.p1 TRINITY_DN3903_c0_g1~~TRINITY_DN3903_c0_g1_i20.p1  ORF type:complete len:180 (+),score=22.60 TRINITY_DN3903_c0_g1_i20:25-540(+)
MIRRPPRSTRKESSAASDVYKRQVLRGVEVLLEAVYVLVILVNKGISMHDFYVTAYMGICTASVISRAWKLYKSVYEERKMKAKICEMYPLGVRVECPSTKLGMSMTMIAESACCKCKPPFDSTVDIIIIRLAYLKCCLTIRLRVLCANHLSTIMMGRRRSCVEGMCCGAW